LFLEVDIGVEGSKTRKQKMTWMMDYWEGEFNMFWTFGKMKHVVLWKFIIGEMPTTCIVGERDYEIFYFFSGFNKITYLAEKNQINPSWLSNLTKHGW